MLITYIKIIYKYLSMSAIQEVVWKSIPGYSNYEASDNGKIRNKHKKELTSFDNKSGFKVCKLTSDNNKRHAKKIDYLVAITYLSNDNNYTLIKHLNNINSDDNLLNLKWISVDEIKLSENNRIIEKDKLIDINIINNSDNIEIWKSIPNFSNYEASTFGNIRNEKKIKNLIFNKNQAGYLLLSLVNNNNITYTVRVHQIIGLTFLENPENKPTINHKNQIKDNNYLDNLEWSTMKEQNSSENKIKNGGERIYRAIIKYDLNDNQIGKYESMKIASLQNNISYDCIKTCARGKTKTAGGYIWKYEVHEDLPEEIWKNIDPKFIDNNIGYKISNKGRVKNKHEYLHSLAVSETGYIRISISNKEYGAHRLVSQSFIPNPNNYSIVNHLDGIKYNNFVENLEWSTIKLNNIHAIETGLSSTQKKVNQYSLNGKFIKEFESISKASIAMNVAGASISYASIANKNIEKNEKYATCANYIWVASNGIFDNLEINKVHTSRGRKAVIKSDKNGNTIETYNSITSAGKDNNIPTTTLMTYIENEKIKDGYFYRLK
jgi:hypothetical protein